MSDREHETVDRWMTYLERQGKSPLTREAYLNTLNHFMSWLQQTYDGEFDPQEVIARGIQGIARITAMVHAKQRFPIQ